MTHESEGMPPLASLDGWRTFMSQNLPEPPALLPEAAWQGLDRVERAVYDQARTGYHDELLLVSTPAIRRITTTGMKLIARNGRRQTGRKGLIVSGPSGTGKTTSVSQLGKRHQLAVDRRSPVDISGEQVPVVYIVTPPAVKPRDLVVELAAFLGLPYAYRESPQAITHNVISVLHKVGCRLIVVDEIHNLDLTTRNGQDASDQLKYLFEQIQATFVYAGVNVSENGLFSGLRGRQLAGRFITLHTGAFDHDTTQQREDWERVVATMESTLRLHRHTTGTLRKQAAYLHRRTGGMIGSLDQLIYEAANDAIADGTEKITKRHLEAVVLDTAAEESRR
ncbi:TniB family NTP-binding protein [Streptomyces sp. PTY087I2]|uniref:TniB family NTP-binding protein n=1 Tax=Streptomyces sp. PTY087I2 TaxID=1819298 RepID=UPI000827742F|nr:TniB family NTP-binding protein [Streptomyces sp. PTY087I2]OCC08284.1 Bacterial TniB protein [Streptomyces sp. PTY087I2]